MSQNLGLPKMYKSKKLKKFNKAIFGINPIDIYKKNPK